MSHDIIHMLEGRVTSLEQRLDKLEHKTHPKVTVSTECFCSFCGRGQREALCIIAGPACYICDECAVLAHEIVLEKRAECAKARETDR